MEYKVDRATAENDVTRWLDEKRVKPAKRQQNAEAIEALTDAIQSGTLELQDDCSFKMNLDFPIPGDNEIPDLLFKHRLQVREIHAAMKGVKANDADGRVAALIAALTGKPGGIVKLMDSNDYSVAQNIAVFFL